MLQSLLEQLHHPIDEGGADISSVTINFSQDVFSIQETLRCAGAKRKGL